MLSRTITICGRVGLHKATASTPVSIFTIHTTRTTICIFSSARDLRRRYDCSVCA